MTSELAGICEFCQQTHDCPKGPFGKVMGISLVSEQRVEITISGFPVEAFGNDMSEA